MDFPMSDSLVQTLVEHYNYYLDFPTFCFFLKITRKSKYLCILVYDNVSCNRDYNSKTTCTYEYLYALNNMKMCLCTCSVFSCS